MSDSIYYDLSKIMKRDALFYFILGARSVGKTYAAKKRAVDNFLENGEQFVYLRRYKSEVSEVTKDNKFWADFIKNEEYPEHTLEVKGKEFLVDKKVAGYCISLSTGKIHKSTSYPNVTMIVFDEFIIDKGLYHYIPDEVTNFLEMYATIDRYRGVKCLFLANSISIANPYFDYFNVNIPYGSNISVGKQCAIEIVEAKQFAEYAKSTKFGELVKGTPYGDYLIENEFLRDTQNFIQKKSGKLIHLFKLIVGGKTYGVWFNQKDGLYFVSNDTDSYCKINYSFTREDHSEDTLRITTAKKSYIYKTFIEAYALGCVRFETQKIKSAILSTLLRTM